MFEPGLVQAANPWALALLAFVTLQRLTELAWARANERRLLQQGAVEVGAGHYPLIVLLHTAWILWLWLRGWDRAPVLGWVVLFIVLQAGRVWVLATLGRRWTARVLVIPGETLVAKGPFRFFAHPNYAVVAAEMAVLPLTLRLPGAALVFGGLNLLMLAWRIRVEERALKPLRP